MDRSDTTTAGNRGSEKELQRGNYTTTAKIQRLQILAHLLAGNSLTTQQARLELCIMSPAPRVLELRRQGYKIVTERTIYEDSQGKHSIARYILLVGGNHA